MELTLFDLATMPITTNLEAIAQEINAEHEQVQGAMRSSLAHAVKVGELLLQAKAMVGHGNWLQWITDNCSFAIWTAQ